MKSVLRFIVWLLMPLVLIALGAGSLGIGATNDLEVFIYAGFALIGAGILWGVLIFMWADSGML